MAILPPFLLYIKEKIVDIIINLVYNKYHKDRGGIKMKKKLLLRPFAPNGLLTDTQTEQLKAWWNGEKRVVSTREIAKQVGVSRAKLYNSFSQNPDRPFDEMKLAIVNNLIQLYNVDIQQAKELEKNKEKEEAKKTKSSVKRAEELIKKVGE